MAHLKVRSPTGTLVSGANPSTAVRAVFRQLAARGYAVAAVISLLAGVPASAEPAAHFTSLDAAAHAALVDAVACSELRVECGGVIFTLPDGQFAYTAPITSDKPFGVSLEDPYASAPGKIVADYHVHICSIHNAPFAPYFSASDALLNQGLHTIGYMVDECTWDIHRYSPLDDDADDEEVDFHSGKVIFLTIGHIVGWLSPQERVPDQARAVAHQLPRSPSAGFASIQPQ